jgi:hypothetical protein
MNPSDREPERVGRATGAPSAEADAAAPAWLREYLVTRTGPTHAMTVKLEPFVAWLGTREPASVTSAELADLFKFWMTALGAARTRATLEVMRDLFEWLRTQGVGEAGPLWGVTEDFVSSWLPALESAAPEPRAKRRFRGGIADVFASCGVMLISVVLVLGGWIMSKPASPVAGAGGFGPVMPLVAGAALGAPLLLGGYVLLLLSARRLGGVPARVGWTVLGLVGTLSLAFCLVGTAGAVRVLGMGSLVYALPFIAFAVAGAFGAVSVVGPVVDLVLGIVKKD